MTRQLKEALINEGLRLPDAFKGCSDEEIQQLMQAQNVKRLPEQFIEYLEVMGHGGISEIFISDDADYHSMLYLKESLLNEIESDNPKFVLPDNAFVFFGHHDVQFNYFLTENNDDPSVYSFIPGRDDYPQVSHNKLSDYFEAVLQLFRRLKRSALRVADDATIQRSLNQ